jgi:hypothetical protein
MNRLYPTELTAVRADAKLFFDRPEDGSEIIGVITEIEPEEDELHVKMGLGDCEFHGMLLRMMGIEDVSVPLSGKMAYSQAIIRGSSTGIPRRKRGQLVKCMLFDMRRDRSDLSTRQTVASAYMASLALGELLRMPRKEIDKLEDPSDLVFGVPQMQQLNKKIGRRVIVDRE